MLTGGDLNGFDKFDGLGGYNKIVGGWSYDVLRVTDNLTNLINIKEIDGGDGQPGCNTTLATDGNDTLHFSGYVIKSFVIDGGAGNDTITGTSGDNHMLASLGGIIIAARVGRGDISSGGSLLMDAVAAALIGLTMLNAPYYTQDFIKGAVLVGALAITCGLGAKRRA